MINLEEAGQEAVDEELERLRRERHKQCAAVVVAWLTQEARKVPVPDLQKRVEKMTEDIYDMTEAMELKLEKGEIVVRAKGSGEQTLKQLLLGTKWFEPDLNVVAQIVSGLFKE